MCSSNVRPTGYRVQQGFSHHPKLRIGNRPVIVSSGLETQHHNDKNATVRRCPRRLGPRSRGRCMAVRCFRVVHRHGNACNGARRFAGRVITAGIIFTITGIFISPFTASAALVDVRRRASRVECGGEPAGAAGYPMARHFHSRRCRHGRGEGAQEHGAGQARAGSDATQRYDLWRVGQSRVAAGTG